MKQLLYSLRTRFLVCYVLLTLIPIALLYQVIHTHSVQTARQEIINAQTEAIASNQQYLQYLLMSIETRYHQFGTNMALTEILDQTAKTEREVMYNYVREVSKLIQDTRSSIDLIDSISFYSRNDVASEILPNFYSMDELNVDAFPESYSRNPYRALFQRFWCVEETQDGKVLSYYAGIMDPDFQRLYGVLAIRCKPMIWSELLADSPQLESSCVFLSGELVYSHNLTPEKEQLFLQEAPYRANQDAIVTVDEQSGMVTSWFSLSAQNMVFCRIHPIPAIAPPSSPFWAMLCLLIPMILLVMLILFHPLIKISQLARHMKSVQSIPLQPFPNNSRAHEVQIIISEYNALVQRINEMTQAMNQKELLLRNAQIERLQAQLNPHFFYGTLESIRMIAEIDGQTEIAEIAYDFSTLMRYSLSRDYFVPLIQELDNVRKYIAIQKRRVGSRFTFVLDINVSTEDWLCPKFMLFSLVENSFTHDVNKTRRQVHIQASVQEEGDELVFSVRNDGPGIEPQRLQELRYLMAHPEERKNFSSQNNGRSIFNINDRLAIYYGDNYRFEIDSVPDEYTVCSVKINRTARFPDQEGGLHA